MDGPATRPVGRAGPGARYDWARAMALLGLMVPIVVFWERAPLYPLRILVVFFHELSHAAMAILTGGSVERIEIVAAEGGLCLTRGGSRFLTLSAGYLGSLVVGGVLLVAASRSRLDRWLSGALGLVLIGATLGWVRPLLGFGFAFGLGAGAALVAAAIYLGHGPNEAILQVVGLTSCLYAVLDIKSDVLDRPGVESDARMLADAYLLPAVFWGALWIVLAVAGALLFLAASCRRGTPAPAAGPAPDAGAPRRRAHAMPARFRPAAWRFAIVRIPSSRRGMHKEAYAEGCLHHRGTGPGRGHCRPGR